MTIYLVNVNDTRYVIDADREVRAESAARRQHLAAHPNRTGAPNATAMQRLRVTVEPLRLTDRITAAILSAVEEDAR